MRKYEPAAYGYDPIAFINIVDDVRAERTRAAENLPENWNDNAVIPNDWIAFITAYLGRAAQDVHRNEREGQKYRENMVKVAHLAIRAIEIHDQNKGTK